MSLKSQLYKIEDTIAEEHGISVEAAKRVVQESSFSDYLQLSEATTQGTTGTMGSALPSAGELGQGGSDLPDWYDTNSPTKNNIDATKFKPGDTLSVLDNDGKPVDVEFSKSLSNDTIQLRPNPNLQSQDMNVADMQLSDEQMQQIQDTETNNMMAKLKMAQQSGEENQDGMEEGFTGKGKPNPYGRRGNRDSNPEPKSKVGKFAKRVTTGRDEEGNQTDLGRAASTFKRGMASAKGKMKIEDLEEQEELMRIKELAGVQDVEETCSAGATGAGGIASAPSIVGDTAHRPTEKLRHKRNKKRNDKGRERSGKSDNS